MERSGRSECEAGGIGLQPVASPTSQLSRKHGRFTCGVAKSNGEVAERCKAKHGAAFALPTARTDEVTVLFCVNKSPSGRGGCVSRCHDSWHWAACAVAEQTQSINCLLC